MDGAFQHSAKSQKEKKPTGEGVPAPIPARAPHVPMFFPDAQAVEDSFTFTLLGLADAECDERLIRLRIPFA